MNKNILKKVLFSGALLAVVGLVGFGTVFGYGSGGGSYSTFRPVIVLTTTTAATDAICPNGMTAASNCTTAPVVTTTTETLCPNGMTAASNCTTAPTTVTTTKAPGLIVAQLQKVLKTLRIGERNSDDANALQLFLINQNKGVAAQALAKNGATKYFGPLTRAALIEWQAANQLVADGIFGPKSKAKALGL